jgi:thioredoxin reductase (NADPH)
MQDCIVVGGGPGGLATAIYLARFRLRCTVIDKGSGRASRIPRCRNFPGFPDGIPGAELLARMREQLARYADAPIDAEAIALERMTDGLSVKTTDGEYVARTVVLATGMRDVPAPFEREKEHDEALAAGLLHYCPVCDGYEVSGKPVTVFGSGHHGVKEALFLRGFTDSIQLVCPTGRHDISGEDRAKLRSASIAAIDGPVQNLRLEDECLHYTIEGRPFKTIALYVAMGCTQRSNLAQALGARLSQEGCVVVDAHQRANVENCMLWVMWLPVSTRS